MTISEAIQSGIDILLTYSIDSAQLDAEVLLLAAFNSPSHTKNWLYTHLDEQIPEKIHNTYSAYILRRCKNEPVAYITNTKAFFGLDYYVDEHVLIPRPETEMMVEYTLKYFRNNLAIAEKLRNEKIYLIDVGTGSGAIAISVASHLQHNAQTESCFIIATDVSQAALEIAQKNAQDNNVHNSITFLHGDLFEPVLSHYHDALQNSPVIVTANLPYLSEKDIKNAPADLAFEPLLALYSEEQGLSHYRRLLACISQQVTPENSFIVLLEHHQHQTSLLHQIITSILPHAKYNTVRDAAGLLRLTIVDTEQE